jgi:hypothetical protein
MADTMAYVLVTTDRGGAKSVAQAVAALDGVHWAAEVSGPCDVITGVRVSGSSLLGSLVATIAALPGVRGTETALMSAFHVGHGVSGRVEPP